MPRPSKSIKIEAVMPAAITQPGLRRTMEETSLASAAAFLMVRVLGSAEPPIEYAPTSSRYTGDHIR